MDSSVTLYSHPIRSVIIYFLYLHVYIFVHLLTVCKKKSSRLFSWNLKIDNPILKAILRALYSVSIYPV